MLDENNQLCAYELTACNTSNSEARMVLKDIFSGINSNSQRFIPLRKPVWKWVIFFHKMAQRTS